MKTIAVIVASLCLVGAAMAQNGPATPPATPPAAAPLRRRLRWLRCRPPRQLPHRPMPPAPPANRKSPPRSSRARHSPVRRQNAAKMRPKQPKLKGAAATSFTKKCVADATKA